MLAAMERRHTPSPREPWVDVAKGLAILAVALYHSALIGMGADLVDDSWRQVNTVLSRVRMPLFFFASGLFAATTVQRRWPRLWSGTMAKLVWCFVVWAVIRFAYFQLVPLASRPQEHDVHKFLMAPIWPVTGLWYLHALVIFYVVTKLMYGRIPVAIQLAGAAVLSVLTLSSVLDIQNLSYGGGAKYYVFFLAAAHFRTVLLPLVTRTPVWLPLPLLALFGGASVVVRSHEDVPGAVLAVCVVGVVASCATAAVLSRTRLAAPFSYLGQRTIYIYVSHILLVCLALRFLELLPEDTTRPIAMITPLLVAAWAVVSSILLWLLIKRTPLNVLYEPPSWFTRDRGTSRTSRTEGSPSVPGARE